MSEGDKSKGNYLLVHYDPCKILNGRKPLRILEDEEKEEEEEEGLSRAVKKEEDNVNEGLEQGVVARMEEHSLQDREEQGGGGDEVVVKTQDGDGEDVGDEDEEEWKEEELMVPKIKYGKNEERGTLVEYGEQKKGLKERELRVLLAQELLAMEDGEEEDNPTKKMRLELNLTRELQTIKKVKQKDKIKKNKKSRTREYGVPIPENELVNHSIELLKHKRELETCIERFDEEAVVHRVGPVPQMNEYKPKGLTLTNTPLMPRQASDVIQQRLPVLLGHCGYTHFNQMPFDVLSEVLEQFYSQMAHRLKQVTEMEMLGCGQDFPDPLERVLVEMGMGGVRGLEKFYETRVVQYRKRLEAKCFYLRQLYARKIRQKVGMPGVSSSSASSSTSPQVVTPGNRTLADILSGLEEPMGNYSPLSLLEQEETTIKPSSRTTSQDEAQPSVPVKQQISLQSPGQQPIQITISSPSQPPRSTPPSNPAGTKQFAKPPPKPPPSTSSVNNMVSINLNNNVDLGGFVPITSPGAASRLNVRKDINTAGVADSKAKLKEALNQRNLLRLNFEQVPSTCESTVLLSSSSTSISSSSSSNPTVSAPTSQTTRLKL